MRSFKVGFLLLSLLLVAFLMLSPLAAAVCPMAAPIPVAAQDASCPNVLLQALDYARNNCTALGRNRACYGNVVADAEAQSGVSQFHFSAPGDIVNLTDLKSIQLGAYNPATDAWGIVLMRVQANLPDNAPGQNALVLMFGNVNAVQGTGPARTPMQAFVFRTAIDPAFCRRLPSSGIILQSPKGAGKVEMVANGVTISMSSTVFLQSQPLSDMSISTIEGNVTVEAQGFTMRVPAGSTVRVPMDQNSQPAGPPAPPEPYNLDLQPALQLQRVFGSTTVSSSNPRPNCRNS